MSTKPAKSNGNRKLKYNPHLHILQANILALCGFKDSQIAEIIEISETTLHRWKSAHPDFRHTLKKGKEYADGKVAESLYHRARGYYHPEDKIFLGKDNLPVVVPTTKHYAPDTTAAIFWLKNRQPALWRDKHDITVKGAVLHLSMDLGDGKPVELNAAPGAIEGVVEGEDGDDTT